MFISDTQEGTAPFLLEMRRALPSLPEGEEVLARWSDEGWYYRASSDMTVLMEVI